MYPYAPLSGTRARLGRGYWRRYRSTAFTFWGAGMERRSRHDIGRLKTTIQYIAIQLAETAFVSDSTPRLATSPV